MANAPRAIDERLAAALPAGSLFAVGGRVRDEVRSEFDGVERAAKDLDYVVVGVELPELVARLRSLGSASVVGASFAVVKATMNGVTADVALPRRERSTGLGHRDFAVEFGPGIPLTEDLARRDFRMNMLARAVPRGELVDPYGGRADIAARRIDVLRVEAFEEDPLRILRACQFAARFGFAVTPRTREAMKAAAQLALTVSPERVRDELIKLVGLAPQPSVGIELLREIGVLSLILPELTEGVAVEQNEYHAYDVYRHNLHSVDATPPGDLVLRFATLLHDIGKPRTKDGPHFYGHEVVGAELSRAALERLRFSGDDVQNVTGLVRNHMFAVNPEQKDGALRRFVRRVGIDQVGRQFALRRADIAGSGLPKRGDENELFEARVRELLERKPPLSERDLAIRGSDVVAALIAAKRLPAASRGGPQVGTLLRRLLDAVYDDPELNTRESLTLLLQREIAENVEV